MDGINVPKKTRSVSMKTMVIALVMAAVVPSIIFQYLLMFMYVPSESMYPTMTKGDTLFGTRTFSGLERGNIVAFQSGSIVMIKRIIGLPGDEVYIDETGSVFVNGVFLEEPYVQNGRAGKSQNFLIPEGHILLLGDNRSDSYDARYWENPYISEDSVLAIAEYKLFSGKIS